MHNTDKLLIKNGIKEIISENDENFKNSIAQALALKLNDSITTVRNEISKNLVQTESYTVKSENIDNFINFIETTKPGKFIFQDGSSINITESQLTKIKNLFESLNPKNRELMAQNILKNAIEMNQHLDFANNTKDLL